MITEIIDILREIRPEHDFIETSMLLEEGLLDSFDLISLTSSLDDSFNISIDGEDIIPENFETINSIVTLVSKYIEA